MSASRAMFRFSSKPVLSVSFLLLCVGIRANAQAQLTFTTVPPYGDTTTPLSGKAIGISTADYEVAVLIFVEGLGWYSKPFCDQTTVPIQADGSWQTSIVTGGVDETANRIAAFLVPVGTIVPCTGGAAGLPSELFSESVAHIVVNRPNPAGRVIDFSGLKWQVKANSVPLGPGPCVFSDSSDNVWVDGFGFLHLRITNVNGTWHCGEIYSQRIFGYGRFDFLLGGQVSNLDPNVVLGLFTWDDTDASYSNREIDIEFSRFGNAADPTNSQFVVQPFALPGHLVRFSFPNDTSSLQSFDWRRDYIIFSSFGDQGQLVKELLTTAGVPPSGTQNVRMNLWTFNSIPPTAETEVIIQRFNFTPAQIDLDGDGLLDYAVWRPTNGSWYAIPSSSPDSQIVQAWGQSGDIPVQGDFDGDGKLDYAVWRPSIGMWFVIPSGDSSHPIVQPWGMSGDIPVVGDYDGDGIADFAVWRPSTGTWFVIPSSNPSHPIIQAWGVLGDIPVPGDYDGDGLTDLAIWRPSSGTWFIIPSTNPVGSVVLIWGTSGDMPVPGDYDGDGLTDFGVWRPSTGTWFVIPSSAPDQPIVQQLGVSGDIPVPRDYDSDSKTDFAVWRPSNGVWYVLPSSMPNQPRQQQWGLPNDVPAYVPPGLIPAILGIKQ